MKTKKLLPVTIGLCVLCVTTFAVYLHFCNSAETGGNWDGRFVTQLDAQSRIDYFTQDIRFEYDSSVLPSTSYAALDSVIDVIKHYESEKFQYIFEVHSQQDGRNDADELRYAQQTADALRKYVMHSGIAGLNIEAVGVGTKRQDCFEDKGDAECFHRNNRLEIKVR